MNEQTRNSKLPSDVYYVQAVQKWRVTDKETGEVITGTKVYVDNPERTEDANNFGCKPITFGSMGHELYTTFAAHRNAVPGLFTLKTRLVMSGKKPTIVIEGATPYSANVLAGQGSK